MRGKKITGNVTRPVILGQHHYGDTLIITASGEVDPSALSQDAISAPATVTGAKIVNHGLIIGGPSDNSYHPASSGIFLANTGFVGNDGTIDGGAAVHFTDGAGGTGIDLQAGGTIANGGNIAGGAGYGYFYGGGGGGITLGGIGKVTNTGTIAGGAGEDGGTGGIGVALDAGGTAVNHGLIQGGQGAVSSYYGHDGGAGLLLGGAGVIFNSGTIFGGDAGLGDSTVGFGGNGVSATTGTLVNQGLIAGGGSESYGTKHGGDGVNFSAAAHLSNSGTIEGGSGLGNGVDLARGGTLNNAGTIIGGYGTDPPVGGGGGAGGVGVIFGGSGILANAGAITGGTGSYLAGHGGGGVEMTGPGELLNHGRITGGDGNIGQTQQYRAVGGAGVILAGGATLQNTGTITGGSILVYGGHDSGNGGAGVDIDGGTLITSGTIAGGAPGASGGTQGDAVQFGRAAGTLQVAPSAIFNGDISANAAVNDVLVLAGSAAGTLAGFGTSITGFTTIVENAHANWTLSGTIANPAHGQGAITLDTNTSLTLTGTVQIAAIAFGADDLLKLDTPAAVTSVLSGFGTGDTIDLSGLQAGSLSYAGGTLTLYGPGEHVVDTLAFAGSYTTGDFGLHPDGAGGTDIAYTGQDQSQHGNGDLLSRPQGVTLWHVPSHGM
jgi:hypothetical protein